MPENDGTVLLEGVRIVFRNFTGKEGKYNREGERGFGVILPSDEVAEQMLADGWNVKYLKPREEDEGEEEVATPWLEVKVGYGKGRPPVIAVVTSRGRTNLGEQEVEMLDWADITNVDMVIRPYNWDVQGKQGIAAYLKTMFVTIVEDPLEAKYAAMDEQ